MMRFLLLLLVLAVSAWLGVQLHNDPGYVLLSYRLWLVEMPLWVAVLLLLVLFGIAYAVLRFVSLTGALGAKMRGWANRRRAGKARLRTQRGLIALTEGQWQVAEKDLVLAASNSELPVWNYLAAAYTAQRQKDHDKRNQYIEKALKAAPAASLGIQLFQAQLQIQAQQWQAALTLLTKIRHTAPHNCQLLRLLASVHKALAQWQQLIELLPILRKSDCYSAEEFAMLQKDTYQSALTVMVPASSLATLQAYWRQLPRELHKDAAMIYLYAAALIKQGIHREAEKLIYDTLTKHWDEKLVALYGKVEGANLIKQLAIAETWLQDHPDSPSLLLTLGYLCLRNKLWGKARSYLESSIKLMPDPQAYLLLGQLQEQLGDKIAATHNYHQGLAAAIQPTLTPIGYHSHEE